MPGLGAISKLRGDEMSNVLLSRAIQIAANAHAGQLDRGGAPYILHPLRVMQRLRTHDYELMCVAILHDVVEDCADVTIESLEAEGFSERVLSALFLMTHTKDETYDAYIQRIATNEDASLVKLEDLRDNSDITRLKGLRDKDFERLAKYNRAYKYLSEVLSVRRNVYGATK